jgi:rubrerythrin
MNITLNNLKEAFAGESQAVQKYLNYAEKAEKDGFANIAKLFKLTAEAERIHAEGHFKALEGVGSTVDNLKAAIAGESYEYKEMYPPMLEAALAENHKAKRMFEYAVKAEEIHAKLYKMALDAAEKGEDLNVGEIYLCPVCGHIEFGNAPDKCPICKTLGSKYVTYEQYALD